MTSLSVDFCAWTFYGVYKRCPCTLIVFSPADILARHSVNVRLRSRRFAKRDLPPGGKDLAHLNKIKSKPIFLPTS
jgi:hypothetical protein